MLASTEELLRAGLSQTEAEARLRQYGLNALPETPPVSLWRRLLEQFRSPLIYILLFALATDLAIWLIEGHQGWPLESFAIALILLLNAGLSVYQERKAEAALAHLKALAESSVWVVRDEQVIRLPSTQLVPGDLVRVESGERVPADGRLVQAQGILVDESIVTGESLPIEKLIGDEVLSATLLSRGKGYMEVGRTGADSTAGGLAVMIGAIEAEKTPLERRLSVFAARIARWILLLTAAIAVAGILVEGFAKLGHVFLFAVALAVAVVPEGLPAVLTLTLALGVERMARKKAVVRKLSAVEALGSVTVIATDKTGTLTENRMSVKEIDVVDTNRALRAMTLANDAEPGVEAGDPLELALLDYAANQGVDPADLSRSTPRLGVSPFDSSRKFMRVTVTEEGQPVSYLKGAPEILLARSRMSEAEHQSWAEKGESYAARGYRMLALAWREGEGENDLTFLGLALLWDPPRAEVAEAIRQSLAAGIRVVMVTGDHPATALAIANEVGIPTGRVVTGPDLENFSAAELDQAVKDTNVFARVTPQDKLHLVEALKTSGEIVAVTGDGVNDAPALKRSDVGVAMGQRGSDVSREVSDLVLLDDNFATIVAAIKEGRNIYENIQKFIRFLFSTNLSETLIIVMGVVGSVALGLHDSAGLLFLPLTASQLLWVNVVTDGPPALALGLDRDAGVLTQSPRDSQAALLDSQSLQFILITGIFKAIIGGALLAGLPQYGYGLSKTRTLLFLYMTIGQLVFAYPARRINGRPTTNIALHLAVLFGVGLQLMTVRIPALRALLGLERVNLADLLWVGGAVGVSWGVAEAYSRLSVWATSGSGEIPLGRSLPWLRRLVVGVVGITVIVIGIAMLVLPGPGLITIALGLAIMATEFVWARALLQKARAAIKRKQPQREEN
ncbi:MAG TPA: HAD-IC family P-type ATPase [Pyrinomonadaceae bacterium]|nr:HAD-IC family P-type ATPase [Pyrinomonadaceae bacterium]